MERMQHQDTVYSEGLGRGLFREISFSGPHALAMMVLLMALASTLSLSFYAQWATRHHQTVVDGLMLKLVHRQGEIDARDGHLLALSGKIHGLKETLLDLYAFEKKIRVIADLGPSPVSDPARGMGGASPEDIGAYPFPMARGGGALAAQLRELDVAAEAEMARLDVLYDILYEKRLVLDATPSICPTTGWNSSRFGPRISPFSGKKSVHKGYDIANYVGTPIIAPADGVVAFAGKRGSMGIMVSLDHGYGMVTHYGHLSKVLKKRGDRVTRGEKIALMGNTGRSTGPHLHYEVRVNGIPMNPVTYILD